MDMRILKYPLPIRGAATHLLPPGAQILSVGAQDDQPYLWAMADSHQQEKADIRDFYVAFTGETLDPRVAGSRFLGRISTTGLELHVFEVPR